MALITHIHNHFTYLLENELQFGQMPSPTIISQKYPDIPDTLFHYYNLSQNSLDSFLGHYIYANHPFEFNDPFDCNRELISFKKLPIEDILVLNASVSKPEILKQLYFSKKKKDKSLLYDLLKYLVYNVIYMKTGIFCMSSKNNSMEMWSYYTNHKGFILEFNLRDLPVNHWGPFPINYTNTFKPIDYSTFKGLSFIYQSNIKAKCWEHESEWRIIFYGPSIMTVPFKHLPDAHNRIFYYEPCAIKQIILGFSFFEISEYISNGIISDKYLIRLKKNIKTKRQILQYIIANELSVSMINLKRESSSKLSTRPIGLKMISPDKYEIKYSV
jgi:hypothetical protein